MDPSEDSPSSMWMIRAAELFPKLQIEKEDDELSVPFSERKYGEKNCKNNKLRIIIFLLLTFSLLQSLVRA